MRISIYSFKIGRETFNYIMPLWFTNIAYANGNVYDGCNYGLISAVYKGDGPWREVDVKKHQGCLLITMENPYKLASSNSIKIMRPIVKQELAAWFRQHQAPPEFIAVRWQTN